MDKVIEFNISNAIVDPYGDEIFVKGWVHDKIDVDIKLIIFGINVDNVNRYSRPDLTGKFGIKNPTNCGWETRLKTNTKNFDFNKKSYVIFTFDTNKVQKIEINIEILKPENIRNVTENNFDCLREYLKKKPKSRSETSKVRERLVSYCNGDGIDIGYGGDPIVPYAITMDLTLKYANYLPFPQHLHGDATNLKWFRNNTLDFVYSSHVLEDFIDTEAVLAEWLRVLKPGGNLILFLPEEGLYRKYCRENGKEPNAHHIHDLFGLKYMEQIVGYRSDCEIVHSVSPVDIYNFELVLKKL